MSRKFHRVKSYILCSKKHIFSFRLIEEELSTRRSISCLGEKVQAESGLKMDQTLKRGTSAFAETVAIENDELTQGAEKYLKETPVQKVTESCVESLR